MKLQIRSAILAALLLAGFLAGCAQTGNSSSAAEALPAAAHTQTLSAHVSDSDTDASWRDSDTTITLSGSSIAVSGTGAAASGNVVTITAAGTYVVSGTLADGQILIAAASTDEVHLVLNGAHITSKTGAPLYASQCKKLIVTLADGTQNSLTDGGADFQYADAAEEEPNAALFCKDDLTLNGTGSLTVQADFHNGIGSKDNLLIVSGEIAVSAANHGLRGNDSVTVLAGSLSIAAGNDGIQTNNSKDSALGWVLIESGDLAIAAGHDGIQADTAICVAGGALNITTGAASSSDTTSDSYKGMKAATDITVIGGSLVISSEDDSIHANGNITIEDGTLTLSSGDDGIHADGNLTVHAGTIKVTQSYEGLEAANIRITGGDIDLVSSDDGLNAAGGADQSGAGERFGKSSFAASDAYSIDISGGTIRIAAGGDGIDSNGTLTISGGTIVSIIASTPDNGALDADGTVTFTGGTILYGGTGTGSAPGEGSTQSYVYIDSGLQANQEITVQKDGQTLIAFTPTEDLQSLALSSPDIQSGESYDVYSAGSLLSAVTAGSGGSGIGGGPGGRGPGGGMGTCSALNTVSISRQRINSRISSSRSTSVASSKSPFCLSLESGVSGNRVSSDA